jgi:hypothetical protein
MKFNKVISPAALFLLLGAGANAYGQDKEEKPASKPAPQERAQPQQHAPQAKQPAKPVARQAKPQAQQPKEKAQPQQKAAEPRAQTAQPAQPRERAQKPQPAAQQPRQQAGKPQQKPQQGQRAQAGQHQNPAPQGKPSAAKANYTPPLRTRQQAQSWQQKSGWRQDGAWQEHASWQQDRSSNWQADHRTWAQRGGYGGYYIPQASFSLHFGIGNWFRIQNQPAIVDGYPRFEYGGYTFMMVDPWPADWAQDWYSADDVYVGYDNGYYLYNRQYPGEAIAISVVL